MSTAVGRDERPRWVSGNRYAFDWPHTSRFLPWGVALFCGLLWLTPIDAAQLPIPLPVDSKIDRFAIAGLVGFWVLAILAAGRLGPTRRTSIVGVAFVGWLAVSVASVAFNVAELARAEDLLPGIRALSIAVSYAAVFLVVATALRPDEVRSLITLNLVLGSVAAIGVIIEYRTGINWTSRIVGAVPGVAVQANTEAPDQFQRAAATGPTSNPLAVCTILAMLAPLAMQRVLAAPERWRKALWLAVIGLLVVGCFATQRKTAVLVPAVSLGVFALYRPRAVAPYLPLAVLLVVASQAIAPGAISGLRFQLANATTSSSTTERTEDYAAVQPDVSSNLLLGRGYGTYAASKYRYLDNQYLGTIVGGGLLGLLAYLGLFGSILLMAHRLARTRHPEDAATGAAIVGGIAALLLASAFYDLLAFRNVPYLVAVLAGFGVTLTHRADTAGSAAPDELSRDPGPHRRLTVKLTKNHET